MGKELSLKEKAQMKFLVVDDMINMRRTIRNMLRQLGYVHITEAEDGLDAWTKLATTKFDMAIVDWNMPRMTGVELLRKARADDRFANMPIIMITAEVDEGTITEAAETEVDAYIIKPFVAKILEEKIDAVMEKKESTSPLDTLLHLVKVYAGAGQFNKAIEQLRTALRLNPSSPLVYQALGDLSNQRGMLDDAEKAYKKAILLEPKFTRAYDGLAEVYTKKGDTKRSMMVMQDAVSKSPRNASRQTRLGKALLEQGMVKEAKAAFENAVKSEPGNLVMQSEMAESLLAQNLNDEAATLFKSVSMANPTDINVYNRLGIAYRKQGKFMEAIDEYKKALTVDPEDENLYYNLGTAYMSAKMVDNAIAQFNKALELFPDFKEAREALEKIRNREKWDEESG
jgi:tetratricopeptide (TPR) repeat protein